MAATHAIARAQTPREEVANSLSHGLGALLQMRDDSVVRFNHQLVAEIGISDFPKFTALHVKVP